MRLDDALKAVLQKSDPPQGFVDRVMARIEAEGHLPEQQTAEVVPSRNRWSRGLAAAAAFATLVIGAGMYQLHERQSERIEGLRARQEVLLAISIASEKTNAAREAVLEP